VRQNGSEHFGAEELQDDTGRGREFRVAAASRLALAGSHAPVVTVPDVVVRETIGDSVEKTKLRIPKEIESRAGTETLLAQWFNAIPTESSQIDDAVDKVQMLVLKTYSYIRSQMCDQVEIFSESFFKVPMLRQLEMDMAAIQLSDEDSSRYKARRERLETDIKGKQEVVTEIDDCINRITNFKNTCQARGMRMGA